MWRKKREKTVLIIILVSFHLLWSPSYSQSQAWPWNHLCLTDKRKCICVQVFDDCRCVAERAHVNMTARPGQCARGGSCDKIFSYFLALSVLSSFIISLGGTPGFMLLVRSDDCNAFARRFRPVLKYMSNWCMYVCMCGWFTFLYNTGLSHSLLSNVRQQIVI